MQKEAHHRQIHTLSKHKRSSKPGPEEELEKTGSNQEVFMALLFLVEAPHKEGTVSLRL